MKLIIVNTLYRFMCVLFLPFALFEVVIRVLIKMFKNLAEDFVFTFKEYYKDFKYGIYRKEIEHKELIKSYTSNKVGEE